MNHTEAFDLILANAPYSVRVDDTYVFQIHTDHQSFEVTARLLSTFERIQYEIIKVSTL